MPQPPGSGRTHRVALTRHEDANTSVTVAWILQGQLLHLLRDRLVGCRLRALVAKPGSRYLKQRTSPAFGQPHGAGLAGLFLPSSYAYHFRLLSSFMTSSSRSRSTNILRSRVFSASSSFRRRTSSTPNSPYRLR